jgi:PAS domain S-box-containing protein
LTLATRKQTVLDDAQLMRLALEAGPFGTWTYDIDTRYAEMSDFCYEVFGLKPPYQAWDIEGATQALVPEDRERVLQSLRHSIATQTDVEYDARVQRPDGTIVWYWVKGRHVMKDGKLTRLVGVLADVTARKAEEAALAEARHMAEQRLNELETLYRTAPIGLAMFDPVEFRYLNLNDRQAEIVGLPKSEILGKTVTEIAPIPGLQEMFEQVAAGHPVVNAILEGELATRPGDHRYWAVNYFPVYASDGSVQGITAASMEITSQKRTENALIQSEKIAAVGRLASSISHEINNPLEAVMNLIYLARTNETNDEVKQYLNMADTELQRVAQIVTQTLRFYRQATNPTQITCVDLITTVLDLYQGRLINAGVTVQKRKRATRPVTCFEGEIRQVLSNLVGNALDAMPSGGRLILRSRDATHWRTGEPGLCITVADTGGGMSAETRAKIFEPFFTTKGLNGTGLGLWISCELVKKHKGSLRVRSRVSGTGCGPSGTVVTLFLPLTPPADMQVAGVPVL